MHVYFGCQVFLIVLRHTAESFDNTVGVSIRFYLILILVEYAQCLIRSFCCSLSKFYFYVS